MVSNIDYKLAVSMCMELIELGFDGLQLDIRVGADGRPYWNVWISNKNNAVSINKWSGGIDQLELVYMAYKIGRN